MATIEIDVDLDSFSDDELIEEIEDRDFLFPMSNMKKSH